MMRKTALGLSTVFTLAVLAFACIALRRFNMTLRAARSQVSRENSLAFTLEPIAPASGPVFEPVGVADIPTTAAIFDGKLYLAGPSGLAIYDSPVAAPHRLRTGIELPPAPILDLAVAHLRGHPAPELTAPVFCSSTPMPRRASFFLRPLKPAILLLSFLSPPAIFSSAPATLAF
jgi:hypothetical protein